MLSAVRDWMREAPVPAEVIVVDDGSDDGTRATASAFERRIGCLRIMRHIEGRGELESVRTGGHAATGTIVGFGRSDELALSLEALPALFDSVMDGADVVILPSARDPGRPATQPGITRSCRKWLRRAWPGSRETQPAFFLCRAPALRRMMDHVLPTDAVHDPDWPSLAERARCTLTIVRTESPSAP
jgi:glycosyltransferase involved in cell wall biosynthesis